MIEVKFIDGTPVSDDYLTPASLLVRDAAMAIEMFGDNELEAAARADAWRCARETAAALAVRRSSTRSRARAVRARTAWTASIAIRICSSSRRCWKESTAGPWLSANLRPGWHRSSGTPRHSAATARSSIRAVSALIG